MRLSALIMAGVLPAMPLCAQTPAKDAQAEAFRALLKENPAVLEEALKELLAKNPQILQQAIADMLRAKAKPTAGTQTVAKDRRAEINAHARELFASPHQVSFGPADAEITLVEFFDYNCGFCRRSFEDKFSLMAADPKVRVVLKELPVLGPRSVEAARIAIAVRMQDQPGGALYRAFNSRLMTQRGQVDDAVARSAAASAGADMVRLERDLASDEIRVTLDETRRLAEALGIAATPTYIVQNTVVVGAVGLDALRNQIAAVRRQ